MGAIVKYSRLLWVVELIAVILVTAQLLPMLFLYTLDLFAGTIGPDAGLALGIAGGVAGLWTALCAPESWHHRWPPLRWLTVAALVFAAMLLPRLFWNTVLAGGMNFASGSVLAATTAVALHQIVRLIRLKKPGDRAPVA